MASTGTVLVGRTERAVVAARMVGGWDELCARAGFAPGGIRTGQFVTFLSEPAWFHKPIAAAAADWSCVSVLELLTSPLPRIAPAARRLRCTCVCRCHPGA